MTWRDVTLAGYGLVVFAVLALQRAARRPGSRIPSLGTGLGRIMATRSGRVAIMAGWAWVGMHFFAL